VKTPFEHVSTALFDVLVPTVSGVLVMLAATSAASCDRMVPGSYVKQMVVYEPAADELTVKVPCSFPKLVVGEANVGNAVGETAVTLGTNVGESVGVRVGAVVGAVLGIVDGHAVPAQSQKSPMHPVAHPVVWQSAAHSAPWHNDAHSKPVQLAAH
jgi:hypothetical protein